MTKNYHAYTEIHHPLPGYISVNQADYGKKIAVTVRSQGEEVASTIFLTPEQAEHLATDIIAKLNESA